jgi:perosamine synthetase
MRSDGHKGSRGWPPPSTPEQVLSTLVQVLPARRPLALHEPLLGARERELLLDCLGSGYVSSVGAYVDRCEAALADITGIGHAVCTVNGTAALHLCLVLAGVQRGDEVLVPALTFVGTCNPIAHMGAVPHFVDSERATLGVDPQRLQRYLSETCEIRAGACVNRTSGRTLRALVVVHVLGHPAPMEALAALAGRWRLILIEDAAESLGSRYRGRHTGAWGRLAALSFNGNKIVTSGGGGAVLTADAQLARRARHLSTTAKQPHPWAFHHDQVGFNYRLPNLNAALACAQLERLPLHLERKRALAERYRRVLEGLPGVHVMREPADASSNYWLNLLLLDPASRDPLLRLCHDAGILARPFWEPLHRLPMYRDCPRMALPVAQELYARGVCLPSSPDLLEPVP